MVYWKRKISQLASKLMARGPSERTRMMRRCSDDKQEGATVLNDCGDDHNHDDNDDYDYDYDYEITIEWH